MISIFSIIFFAVFSNLQNRVDMNHTTTFILVRHAEKGGTDADPDLSSDGLKRADELRKTLKNVPVAAVYATPYKRTRQTVKPVADEKKIAVTEYSTRTPYRELIDQILKTHQGKVVLIAGHSNTIPELLKALCNSSSVTIAEDHFDNLFVVHQTEGTEPVLLHLKYGQATD